MDLAELSKEVVVMEWVYGIVAVSLSILFVMTFFELKRVLRELQDERIERRTLELKVNHMDERYTRLNTDMQDLRRLLSSQSANLNYLVHLEQPEDPPPPTRYDRLSEEEDRTV